MTGRTVLLSTAPLPSGSAEVHLGSFLKPSWGSAFPGELPPGHIWPWGVSSPQGRFMKPSRGSAFPGELPPGHVWPWGVSSPQGASSTCITSQNRNALPSECGCLPISHG